MLTVSPSPHIKSSMTTAKVMLMVILALLPTVIASGIIFGQRAILVVLVCIATAVIWEFLCRLAMKRQNTLSDLSAVVTGILLGMNLPSTTPFYICAIGTFVAIVIVKQLFGGLGHNFANPAIVGRIVLMLSVPSLVSQWAEPFNADVITSATPLLTKSEGYMDLFLGKTAGCLGETCSLTLLIGFVFLAAAKVISPVTPIAMVGTVAVLSAIFGEDPLMQVLSGGLLLGAIFMATDYVTTPITQSGKLIFGIGCGLITFIIRMWASYPEGVSFSILLMNILTPYIDAGTRKKPVGKKPDKKPCKAGKE